MGPKADRTDGQTGGDGVGWGGGEWGGGPQSQWANVQVWQLVSKNLGIEVISSSGRPRRVGVEGGDGEGENLAALRDGDAPGCFELVEDFLAHATGQVAERIKVRVSQLGRDEKGSGKRR